MFILQFLQQLPNSLPLTMITTYLKIIITIYMYFNDMTIKWVLIKIITVNLPKAKPHITQSHILIGLYLCWLCCRYGKWRIMTGRQEVLNFLSLMEAGHTKFHSRLALWPLESKVENNSHWKYEGTGIISICIIKESP